LSRTVHATVPQNSNSNQSPLVVLAPESPCPNHQIHSPLHGSVPQYHVDPSPSINHVFVEDCSNDEDFDHEEVDFDSSEEDYVGGSKFFTSPMVAAPPVPVVYPTGTQPALLPPPHVLIMLWLLPQPCQLLWMTMSLWLLLQVTTQSLLLALGIIFLRLIATLPSALNSFITLLSLKLEAVIWLMMI